MSSVKKTIQKTARVQSVLVAFLVAIIAFFGFGDDSPDDTIIPYAHADHPIGTGGNNGGGGEGCSCGCGGCAGSGCAGCAGDAGCGAADSGGQGRD